MWGDIAIAFLLAFATAYVITPYTIRLSKKIGALDVPIEKRKIHTKAIPRLGGLAVIAGFTVSTIYLVITMNIEKTMIFNSYDGYGTKLIGFFLGALILSVFCFIDDWKGIPPYVKLLGQLLAAIVVVLFGLLCNFIIEKIVFSSIISILYLSLCLDHFDVLFLNTFL